MTVHPGAVRLTARTLIPAAVRALIPAAVRVAAGVSVCGVALTGCASPGGGASTHNDVSRCAAVLPAARDLVHGQGRLVLVRPVRQSDIDTIVRDAARPPVPSGTPAAPAPSAGPARPPSAAHPQEAHPQGGHPGTPGRTPRLCLVVYQGSFHSDAIPGAQPPSAAGEYALIFLRVRHPSVDRILISDVLPASSHRPWWHF